MNDPLTMAVHQGVEALRAGNGPVARGAFERVEQAGRATPQLRAMLGKACLLAGDDRAAQDWAERALADEPGNLSALILRGDILAAAGDDRAAGSWYQAAIVHAPRLGDLPPEVATEVRRAERAVADAASRFRGHLTATLAEGGADVTAAGPRFAEALAILSGEAEVQLQRPTSFYYPRLPQIAFYEREDFPWIAGLEARADAIRAELAGVLSDDLPAYVTPDPDRPVKRHALLGDPRWSAFYLWRNGAPTEAARARCPETMAALDGLPIPRIAGRSPIALFSVLRPGTHIPPHNGMLNTRLICHLPLIVPEKCRLRVGNETRDVVRDQAMIFDDSVEHEAWNDSGETRVVLLFEIWRPELDAAERAALTTLFEAIGAYGGAAEDQGGA